MSRELNSRTVEDTSRRLAELLALPVSRLKVKLEPSVPGDENNRADLLVSAGNYHFAVEWKASGQASAVVMAVRSIRRFVEASRKKLIPLVAVPFTLERHACRDARGHLRPRLLPPRFRSERLPSLHVLEPLHKGSMFNASGFSKRRDSAALLAWTPVMVACAWKAVLWLGYDSPHGEWPEHD